MTGPIPLLDLSPSRTPEEIVHDIHQAITNVGFLHVKAADLGFAPNDVQQMFRIHKLLYDGPQEERDACRHDPAVSRNGYKHMGHDRLSEGKGGRDVKESWIFGHYEPELGETATSQPIPKSIEANKGQLLDFQSKCQEGMCKILDYFSLAMKLPIHFFRDAHHPATNSVSLINYPPLTAEEAADAAAGARPRAGAHKDWGSVTLLFQEDSGTPGLEVFLPEDQGMREEVPAGQLYKSKLMSEVDLSRGKWFQAPIIPGTVLINVGLAIEQWTSGLYKATLHRVIVPAANPDGSIPHRRSIAFFTQPNLDTVLNPISPEGEIIVTSGAVTSKEFFVERMRAAMAH